jgi:uncharacterized metal-binding protein YceD (DUF177 family)
LEANPVYALRSQHPHSDQSIYSVSLSISKAKQDILLSMNGHCTSSLACQRSLSQLSFTSGTRARYQPLYLNPRSRGR